MSSKIPDNKLSSYKSLHNYDNKTSTIKFNWNIDKNTVHTIVTKSNSIGATENKEPGCGTNSNLKCCNCEAVVGLVWDLLFSSLAAEKETLKAFAKSLAEKEGENTEKFLIGEIQKKLEKIGLTFLWNSIDNLLDGLMTHVYDGLFADIDRLIKQSPGSKQVKISSPADTCKFSGYWEFAGCALNAPESVKKREATNNKKVTASYLACFMKDPICDLGVATKLVTKQNFCQKNNCITWSEVIATFFSTILMNVLADMRPGIFNMCPSKPPDTAKPTKSSLWLSLLSALADAVEEAAETVLCQNVFKCDNCGCFGASCTKHSDCCQDAAGGMACSADGICSWPASNTKPGDVNGIVSAGSKCQTISGWTYDGNQQCMSGSCSDPKGGGTCNKSEIGGKCGNNNDCKNNRCSSQMGGTCVECNENHECGQGKYCDLGTNKCVTGKGTGEPCVPAADSGSQCLSGCCAGGRCVECQAGANWPNCPKLPQSSPGKFCDPTGIFQNKAGNGVACTSNQVCSSGNCVGVKVGGDGLGVCKPAGYCVLPTDCGGTTPYCSNNKCVSKVPNGTICLTDDVCSSGFCVGGKCADQPVCTGWSPWSSCNGRNCPEGGQLRGKQSRSSIPAAFDHPRCRRQNNQTQDCGNKDSCMRICQDGWGCAHGDTSPCWSNHGVLYCGKCTAWSDAHAGAYLLYGGRAGSLNDMCNGRGPLRKSDLWHGCDNDAKGGECGSHGICYNSTIAQNSWGGGWCKGDGGCNAGCCYCSPYE